MLSLNKHIIDTMTHHLDTMNQNCDTVLTQLIVNQKNIQESINNLSNDRIIEFLPNELFWILIAAFVGIFLTQIGNSIKQIRYCLNYKKYTGYYISRLKSDNQEHFFLRITRRKNKFIIKGISIKKTNGKFKYRNKPILGEIILGNVLKNSGTGYYQHEPDDVGLIRSGEYRIQLSPPNKIIATQIISEDDNKQSTPRYIWEKYKKNDSEITELIRMYKESIK